VKSTFYLYFIVALQVLGNASLSHGMRHIGTIEVLSPAGLFSFSMRTITNPWVLSGVAMLIGFFVFYLAALSRLDLSYVLPITASSYIMTAILAWLLLGEHIYAKRWAGTLLVSIGIVLVRRSEQKTVAAGSGAESVHRQDPTQRSTNGAAR
jgi:transporter family protein